LEQRCWPRRNHSNQALNEAFHKAAHLEAPLDERLKLYLGESRKLLPDLESTYDQLVARIQPTVPMSSFPPWATGSLSS